VALAAPARSCTSRSALPALLPPLPFPPISGKHEGTVLGHTYFVTPKKRGTFVKRENLAAYDPALHAASSIQSVGRMSIAKKKVKQEIAWRTFNALDANDEAQHLQRQARLLNTALGAQLTRERPSSSELDAWEREAAAVPVEEGYDGPVVSFPLTRASVLAMLEAFRCGRRMHYRYAMALVGAYRRWATTLPTLVEVSVREGERLTVCGDTHGQLQDLLSIYTINGVPSPTNRYLMNGDFVDRGEGGCEIVFLLMAFCLLYPGAAGPWAPGSSASSSSSSSSSAPPDLTGAACLLNRGNHETHAQNLTGGFMLEVLSKYSGAGGGSGSGSGGESTTDDCGMRLYDALQAAFDCMPLATVISRPEKRVFVVHGGLLQRPGVTLAQISAIKRKRDIPYGLPGFEDKLFEDLMWSDPRPITSTSPSDRGAGVFFGSDVTESFCALNRISLVIRSHECVPEGYQYMHGDRLVTIFSASRYCGRGTNRGAFLQFDANLDQTVRQFVATDLEDTAPALVPPAALSAQLAERYDTVVAVDHAHIVSVGAVTPVVEAGTGAGAGAHPAAHVAAAASAASAPSTFTSAAPVIHEVKPGSIDAAAQTAQAEAVRKMLMERIFLRKPDLYFFYAAADKASSRDGRVSKLVWADGMRTVLDLELPWLNLCSMLAEAEADGRINYTRFLDRYRIAMRDSDLAWMEGITENVCRRLFSASGNLEESFRKLDEDSNGVIDLDELERGLMRMGLGLSRSQVYEVMSAIDADRDGRIQFGEFARNFKLTWSRLKDDKEGTPAAGTAAAAATSSSSSAAAATAAAAAVVLGAGGSSGPLDAWTSKALTRVGEALFRGQFGANAPAVFASIDTNGDGLLSESEFFLALGSLRLGFTDAEMRTLMRVVDSNHSGNINYLEVRGERGFVGRGRGARTRALSSTNATRAAPAAHLTTISTLPCPLPHTLSLHRSS
jgi:Ca2+-binding EF-hand superfamily protein/diadenosine tetraphosphatase ApaH/serine/threonine PP2A family protein phosphatase